MDALHPIYRIIPVAHNQKTKKSSLPNNDIEPECLGKTVQNKFNFSSCFSYFTKIFSDRDEQRENNQTTQ